MPIFSSRNFMVSGLTFKYLINFEFISVHKMGKKTVFESEIIPITLYLWEGRCLTSANTEGLITFTSTKVLQCFSTRSSQCLKPSSLLFQWRWVQPFSLSSVGTDLTNVCFAYLTDAIFLWHVAFLNVHWQMTVFLLLLMLG